MSKENFDFRKKEDQKQFNDLPQEAKNTLIGKAHEDAVRENLEVDKSRILKNLENIVESRGIKKDTLINVIFTDDSHLETRFYFINSKDFKLNCTVKGGSRFGDPKGYTESFPLDRIKDIELLQSNVTEREKEGILMDREHDMKYGPGGRMDTVLEANITAKERNVNRPLWKKILRKDTVSPMDVLHEQANIENTSRTKQGEDDEKKKP